MSSLGRRLRQHDVGKGVNVRFEKTLAGVVTSICLHRNQIGIEKIILRECHSRVKKVRAGNGDYGCNG